MCRLSSRAPSPFASHARSLLAKDLLQVPHLPEVVVGTAHKQTAIRRHHEVADAVLLLRRRPRYHLSTHRDLPDSNTASSLVLRLTDQQIFPIRSKGHSQMMTWDFKSLL